MLWTPKAPALSPRPLVTPLPRKLPISLHPSCVLALLPQNDDKWHDYSGRWNHGIAHGAKPTAKGPQGFAWEFDGVDDWISTSMSGFPDPMTDITIAFRTSPSGLLLTNSLLTAVPDDTENRICLHFPWGNNIIFWDFGNVNAGGRLTMPWNAAWNNVWADWVLSSESGAGQKMYRDTVLLTWSNTWSSFSRGTKTLDIVRYGTTFWKGFIDHFRIYHQAWSPRPQDANYLPEIDPLLHG
ncbi:MAG: hypothetical protein DDT29_01523 [Dehalococcoidia bacterium]|nr:hypothetical protein [Bacillota bacterium]